MEERRWFNVFGEEVDLDSIDRLYALNILSMVLFNHGLLGSSREEAEKDPLVLRLREIVLNGRDRNTRDRLRALRYNLRCRRRGLPYRAPVI